MIIVLVCLVTLVMGLANETPRRPNCRRNPAAPSGAVRGELSGAGSAVRASTCVVSSREHVRCTSRRHQIVALPSLPVTVGEVLLAVGANRQEIEAQRLGNL
jgi:hypothetical protein